MRTVKDQESVAKAKRLYEIVQWRQEFEKNEKQLKTHFKNLIGNDTSIRVGEFVVLSTPKTRNILDRDILVEYFGEDAVHDFEKESRYREVTVVPEESLH